MDAESVLHSMVELRKLEFERMPLESRDRHAMETATPWLEGARHALVTMGAIKENQADEVLRPWFDILHQAGLLEYGDGGGADLGFAAEAEIGAEEEGETPPS